MLFLLKMVAGPYKRDTQPKGGQQKTKIHPVGHEIHSGLQNTLFINQATKQLMNQSLGVNAFEKCAEFNFFCEFSGIFARSL